MKRFVFLSHTDSSRRIYPAGLGEIVNTSKLVDLMKEMKFPVDPVHDIFDLCNAPKDLTYKRLYQLNMDIAEMGYPLLEECSLGSAQKIYAKVKARHPQMLWIFSWHWALATLFATGIQKLAPVVSKMYVHHPDVKVLPTLYAPSDLIVTECLLANQKGIEVGIPSGKMVYLPHHFPKGIESVKPDDHYLRFQKKKETVVIGVVSRLEYRKNIHFLIEAVAQLVSEGFNLLLVLKGNYAGEQPKLRALIEMYRREPWFLWDPTFTPYPDVLAQFATFDVAVNLSGREGASNAVVDSLALGIPTLVLDGTTHPYLFKKGALFVKNDGEMHTSENLTYREPDPKDLIEKLKQIITERPHWAQVAKKVAYERFHPDRSRERIPLIVKTAKAIREGKEAPIKEIEKLYEKDLERHAL